MKTVRIEVIHTKLGGTVLIISNQSNTIWFDKEEAEKFSNAIQQKVSEM